MTDPTVGYDDELIEAFLRREITAADLTVRQRERAHLIVMRREVVRLARSRRARRSVYERRQAA